jgi:hypothetical protein
MGEEANARFTLAADRWYALTLIPENGGKFYNSPILVRFVRALPDARLEIRFLDLAYAAGVQEKRKRFRILRRATSHLLLEDAEVEGRSYVIVSLTEPWLRAAFPQLPVDQCFRPDGEPDGDALQRLGFST